MSSIVIPGKRQPQNAFSPAHQLSDKGRTLGLTSAGVIDGKGQPFDLVVNQFLTPYNDRVPAVASSQGMVLEPGTGTTRSGDAYTIDHLGSTWLDGAAEFTMGVIWRYDGTDSTDEDSLIGKWNIIQGTSSNQNSRRALLRYDNDGTSSLDLFVADTGTTSVSIQANVDLDDGEFHWLVGRYDGTNLQVFVDGQSIGTPTAFSGTITSVSTTTVPEFMGGQLVTTTGSDSPRGQFKGWFISERAWTDAEIYEWYAPDTRWDWVQGDEATLVLPGTAGSGLTVTMTQGVTHVTGQNTEVLLARDVSMQQGVVHATGQNADVITARNMTMTQGVVHATGQNTEVLLGRELNLTQGLTHVTAQNMSITFGRTVTMGQGLVHITGQDMFIQKGNFSPSWTRLSNNIIYIGSRGTKS